MAPSIVIPLSCFDVPVTGYNQYNQPTELSGGVAKVLVDAVEQGEEFILGTDCVEDRFLKRWGTKIILTDKRVILVRSKVIGSYFEDYMLESINNVQYESTTLSDELTLSGSGFDSSYDLPKGMGSKFASEIRKRVD